MIEGFQLELTYLQRWYAAKMMRESRKEVKSGLDDLKTQRSLREKISIPKDEISLYQITYAAGVFGPDKVVSLNRDAIERHDRETPAVFIEIEKAEARLLKNIWRSAIVNDEDLDWWLPVEEQLQTLK